MGHRGWNAGWWMLASLAIINSCGDCKHLGVCPDKRISVRVLGVQDKLGTRTTVQAAFCLVSKACASYVLRKTATDWSCEGLNPGFSCGFSGGILDLGFGLGDDQTYDRDGSYAIEVDFADDAGVFLRQTASISIVVSPGNPSCGINCNQGTATVQF